MPIVHPSPTRAYPGRRWEARRYPGTASTCARFRADLRSDLATLAGIPLQARDGIELCASEAFTNVVAHSRSERPGGTVTVTRMLCTPLVLGSRTTVRLSVIDEGPSVRAHPVPFPRHSPEEWHVGAPGSGLTLIHRLADEWGTRRCPASGPSPRSGTVIWAEFTYLARPTCTCGGLR